MNFDASELPKTNQVFVLKVPIPEATGGSNQTTVTIIYDIVEAANRNSNEDFQYLKTKLGTTNAFKLLK